MTWGDDGHSSGLELLLKGLLEIRVSGDFVQHLTVFNKPIFLQVCKDASMASLCLTDWDNESPWVHIILADLSVHRESINRQNYIIIETHVAVTAPYLASTEIETSPGEDRFTPQDITPPSDRTSYGRVITWLNGLLPSLVPGCTPEVTITRRIWEIEVGMADEEDEDNNCGTGWMFLYNDYVYLYKNPSSADFGIRHSGFCGVYNSSSSQPIPTCVFTVNCFIFWAPRPE